MKQSHVIKRQVLEVEYTDRKQAINGQTHLSHLYKQKIAQVIESVFDRIVQSVGSLRIDHLELDLGVIDMNVFDSELPVMIEKQLTDLLYRKARDPNQKNPYSNGFKSNKSDLIERASADQKSVSNTRKETNPKHNLELFEYYLKTGQLPWWAYQEDFTNLNDLTASIVSDSRSGLEAGIHQFLKSILRNEKFTQRLIYQLSDKRLDDLIDLIVLNDGFLNNIDKGFYSSIKNDLMTIHSFNALLPATAVNFRAFIWKQLIRFYVTENLYKKVSSIIKQYVLPKAHYDHSDAFILHILDQICHRRFDQQSGRPEQAVVNLDFQDFIKELQNSGVNRASVTNSLLKELIQSDTEIHISSDYDTFEKLYDEDISDSKDRLQPDSALNLEDETVIQNAGLAIVAPFLPHFFDHLGLLEDKEFVTDEAARRGVLLLQYLVTLEHEFPEHELCFNKLLCGVELDEPVASQIDISEFEKDEILNLLESVAENWKALKGTSAEGVRRSFLNKPGLLRPLNGSWKLTVERQTIDILVDRLPWPISILKLPWMNTMIYVEW